MLVDHIVVSQESIGNSDVYAVIESNISVVNYLLEEGAEPGELSPDALGSYYVDYYLAEVTNGGIAQFMFNCCGEHRILDHITRAAGNLETVFLPENQIINLEADTLETHPSIDQGWADTARLDWLADPENTIGKVMLPGWCSGEYDSLRDAIDAIINSPTYLERKYGKTKAGRLFIIFEEIFNNKEKAAAGKDVTRSLITGQPINKEQP